MPGLTDTGLTDLDATERAAYSRGGFVPIRFDGGKLMPDNNLVIAGIALLVLVGLRAIYVVNIICRKGRQPVVLNAPTQTVPLAGWEAIRVKEPARYQYINWRRWGIVVEGLTEFYQIEFFELLAALCKKHGVKIVSIADSHGRALLDGSPEQCQALKAELEQQGIATMNRNE